MLNNILLGSMLIIVTIAIHGLATKGIFHFINRYSGGQKKFFFPKSYWIGFIALVMIFASILESMVWAWAYILLNLLSGLKEALYFSVVTYTSLGYGDITLNESHRLLASIEAANGIIIFGWSTAIVMAVVQRIYFSHQPPSSNEKDN